jgi:PAS domain S-box-containing protein
VRAKETEPFGYLLKPVEPRELRTTIELALYRRTREVELHRTHELYRALINAYSEPVLLMDLEGAITACNREAEVILGFASEPVRSKNLLDYIPPEERQAVAASQAALRSGAGSPDAEIKCTLLGAERTRTGVTLRIKTLRDNDNVPRALLAVIQSSGRKVRPSQAAAVPQ